MVDYNRYSSLKASVKWINHLKKIDVGMQKRITLNIIEASNSELDQNVNMHNRESENIIELNLDELRGA